MLPRFMTNCSKNNRNKYLLPDLFVALNLPDRLKKVMWFYFCLVLGRRGRESRREFTNFLYFSNTPENVFVIVLLTIIVIHFLFVGVCLILSLGVLILALALPLSVK